MEGLESGEDAFWGEGELVEADTDCVIEGVTDGWGGAIDTDFGDGLSAEGACFFVRGAEDGGEWGLIAH